MLFTNWMRSYRYRREMNRHWSVSTPRHRSEDDKTICEERTLIDDLFFWISSIIFTRDEIRDHLSRFFLYLTQILFLSVYSRCSAVRERIEFKRSILLNLVSIKFVSLRSQSNLRFLQVIKFLQKSLRNQSNLNLRISNRQIFTMTSDDESIVKRSEEKRRTIITNRKNEDLKKEYLMRRIAIWKRHNLKDSDLWEQFREEFDEWDEAKFVIADSKILKEFRAFLRTHDVWIFRKRDYSIVKALFEVLKKDIETP